MLLEHNKPVYDDLCKTLETHRKAVVVVHTGGGKSFVANEYIVEKDLYTLVVCPKRAICDQWKKLNPDVDTMTYATFSKAKIEKLLAYEAIVLDEAHHCGSPVWGARAREVMERTDGLVIGLTADPVRYSDGGKNVAYNLFDGHIVQGLSLTEAIDKEIIPAFKYICTVIGLKEMIQERVDRLSAVGNTPPKLRTKAEHLIARLKMDEQAAESVQEVLRQHMPDLPKGVVFVDDISAIDEALDMMTEAFPGLPLFSIHSKRPQSENEEQMTAFKGAKKAAIISVDMLGEGVHVDGVNFVVMLRRTQSPTVFFQQLGRTTVVGADAQPVVFDIAGNRCTLKIIESKQGDVLRLFERDNTKKTAQIIVSSYVEDALRILQDVDELLSEIKQWSQEEIDTLCQHYPTEGSNVYKRLPGRTKITCRVMASKLGIKYIGRNFVEWLPEEDEILIQGYQSEGCKIFEKIPRHSYNACRHRACSVLKLSAQTRKRPLAHNKKRPASQKEKNAIKQHYPTEGSRVCERPELQGRSAHWCRIQASQMGIRYAGKAAKISKPASALEDDIIAKYYPLEGGCVCELPELKENKRTKDWARDQAKRLGVKYIPQYKHQYLK